MPLKERTIVEIREEVALAALQGSVSEAAVQFGVSRPTVRLWRDRYREEGRAGLRDRSHATRSCPHRTPPEIEDLIIAEREQWGWGSKKLLARLRERYPELALPRRSTVDAILSRHGLVARPKTRRGVAPRARVVRFRASEPGELTTIDFKGQFRLRDGRYYYPLPQDNGSHERMHRELKADILRNRGASQREQQRWFDAFRQNYNVERPHEGIGQDRPARRFRPSPRPYPRKPRRPDYAPYWEKRKVMSNGIFRWRSTGVFLSHAFSGRTVALEPIDVDRWQVRFYEFIIGTFDERSCRMT